MNYTDTNISVNCRVPKYLKSQLESYYSNKEGNQELLNSDSPHLMQPDYDNNEEIVDDDGD